MLRRLRVLFDRLTRRAWPHTQTPDSLGIDPDQVILHAHDIKNLLAVIAGCASAMNRRADRRLPVDHEFRRLTAAFYRADRRVARLLSADQPTFPERVPLDISRVVGECADMVERVIGDRIRLKLELATTRDPVRAESAEIERIVLNLAMSACDAMPDGGVLTIRTASVKQVPSGLKTPHVRAESYVRITVSDTGSGMPSDVRLRVLNRLPLRTQRGAALSLTVVSHTVHALGGALQIEGDNGLGTQIDVDLRCIEQDG